MKKVNLIIESVFLLLLLGMMSGCLHKEEGAVIDVRLSDSWKIQRSDVVQLTGDKVSATGLDVTSWYNATVPATVFNILVKAGVYKNIFQDNNLEKISHKPFKTSWWYRTNFDFSEENSTVLLKFDGINYKANIWLNGNLVADTTVIRNAFLQFSFNITDYLILGKNVLAVEVFPPRKGDFSLGFVDWNPPAPDAEMGIFRPVWLDVNTGCGVDKPFVVTTLSKDLNEARLTASVEVTNYEKVDVLTEVVLKIDGFKLVKPVELLGGETKKVLFTPDDFDELIIQYPKLWWPHTVGEPHLYHASFEIHDSGRVLDEKSINFGIRTVSDYFTAEGHRGFKINGRKILIRGGGWVDRLLLDDTRESIKSQLEYVQDMNLNTIRLEGFWGNSEAMYDMCDSMGILIMAGWSCHWEWEDYLGAACSEEFGGIQNPEDVDMMSQAWQDQVVWLRNHPSIFAWLGGSDCKPKPALELRYKETFLNFDSTRVYLPSAKEWKTLHGNTGVKMRGPYAYEPPVYWFADTLFGGAFGFNTETGPGAQVPPVESIEKMLSEQHRWPIDSVWNYHCGRHEFNNLNRFAMALEKRYGKAHSLADFAKKAQLLNYELMRPMFEAFSANRYKATGVIQWMLNSAWPEMYWQLYDYYLMPNGAYYGAKKASQPYHVIYNPDQHSLFVVNDRLENLKGCTVKIRVYNKNSKLKFEKEIKTGLNANSSKLLLQLPTFKWNKDVCFLDLRLMDARGNEIDNNFYWLSAKKDVLDYDAKLSTWYFHTPSKQYADFTALNTLPKVRVKATISRLKNKESKALFAIKLENNSNKIAFFIHTTIVNDKTGKTILPVLWSDNYVSLLPHEKRVLTAFINKKDLININTKLIVKGYNE